MEKVQQMMNEENMKTEIPAPENSSVAEVVASSGGLTRQTSITKNNCLCSPTTHAGSFRCRLHRTPAAPQPSSLQRTQSIEAGSLYETPAKKADSGDGNAN
ncbi:PREDICTED: uncharacterized protein LOC104825564 [Tarenaya hassleriana]|uniref:uncharacterized protein LOC104825564 n=1 Tax=Tarenaya hassleriana TaxID=28532 RepID=UPI0008FD9015|nr:PREDICTED: uncharacterized protein LOC104825564 [Tarenaya hassleriana]